MTTRGNNQIPTPKSQCSPSVIGVWALGIIWILEFGFWSFTAVAAPPRCGDNDVVSLDKRRVEIAEKVAPVVVSIKVERDPEPEVEAPKGEEEETPARRKIPNIFAHRPDAPVSGTIIDANGLIVTTYFNVLGAKKVTVKLSGGEECEANILGFSEKKDLVLLKIGKSGLPTLEKSTASPAKAGQMIMAIGRNPDASLSVNPGIVSALDRLLGQAIQIDAKLNYANVGGPLVDMDGKLVGITCNISTKNSYRWGQNSGVGFAVPADMLYKVVPMLKGGTNEGPPGYLGVTGTERDDESDGAKVESVQPGSAAEKGGVEAGDVIVEFDGKKTADFDQLRQAILGKMVGDIVKIAVKRDGKELKLTLTLGARP